MNNKTRRCQDGRLAEMTNKISHHNFFVLETLGNVRRSVGLSGGNGLLIYKQRQNQQDSLQWKFHHVMIKNLVVWETQKAILSLNFSIAIIFFKIDDFPDPEGPEITNGRNNEGEEDPQCAASDHESRMVLLMYIQFQGLKKRIDPG